jgi:hypothetical protein
MMDEESFKAGAKAMFDALQMRIANNWHPRFEKYCDDQNNWAHEWALDALDEVSPEDVAVWRSLNSMYAAGFEAGKRTAPPLQSTAIQTTAID